MAISPTERAMLNGVIADLCICVPFFTVGILSGSAAAITEVVRGMLQLAIDVFALGMMVAINRHRFAQFEFGLEKLQILVQIVIGFSMCLSLVYIGGRILERFEGGGGQPDYLFCLLFAGLSYVNLLLNVGVLRGLQRQQRVSQSLILRGQIKNRFIMLVSSVVATLSSACVIIPDRVLFLMVDAAGAVIVFAVIVWTVVRLLGGGILSLLDAPIEEADKHRILAAVVARYEDWGTLQFLRTRRLGHRSYAEVGLSFDPGTSVEQALLVCQEIEQAIRAAVGETFVAVHPVAEAAPAVVGAAPAQA